MTPRQQLIAFIKHLLSLTDDLALKTLMVPLVQKLMNQVLQNDARPLQWRDEFGVIGQRDRGAEALIKFLPAIDTLKNVWGTPDEYVPIDERMFSKEHLIRSRERELLDLGTFACSDAERFLEYIAPGCKDLVRGRNQAYSEWATTHTDFEAIANQFGAQDQYTWHCIQAGGGLVLQARSACCTTFALAAAYILTRGHDNGMVRVECVSIKLRHCFTIVGRAGQVIRSEGGGRTLPPVQEWGEGTIIIDPWLGSLGHGTVFSLVNYPFISVCDSLESKFDSQAPTTDENPFEAILNEKKPVSAICPKPGCGSTEVEPYSSSSVADGLKCRKCGRTGKRSLFKV